MDTIRQTVHDNLKNIAHAPSVQLQDVPPSFFELDNANNQEEETMDMNTEQYALMNDKYVDQKISLSNILYII